MFQRLCQRCHRLAKEVCVLDSQNGIIQSPAGARNIHNDTMTQCWSGNATHHNNLKVLSTTASLSFIAFANRLALHKGINQDPRVCRTGFMGAVGDLKSCAASVATLVSPSRLLSSSPSFTSFMRGARSPAMRFTYSRKWKL